MAYIDKINKSDVDYDIQDSKAARSVDGSIASHVEEANQIHTTSGVLQTDSFIYRTSAGDASISNGDATVLAVYGNTIQEGHVDENISVTNNFADSEVYAWVDDPVWVAYVQDGGSYTFTYDGSDWKLGGTVVDLEDYGITVEGAAVADDNFTVNYTKLEVGSLTTASPSGVEATGFNQYDDTAGYAHVIGNNQYRVAGTYTSLGFTTEEGGTTTPVTVDENGKFTPSEDGYVYVNGGSGDILIALVWSGIRDNDPFEAYETSTLTFPTEDADGNNLPNVEYGMPSVGDVKDELNLTEKIYIQRIGHYEYTLENLETVEALGVDYIYDEVDIFYVLASPVEYTLASDVMNKYAVNDFGTEQLLNTDIETAITIYYGNNLVDKLRNLADIQTIGSGLALNGGELSASGGGGDSVYSTKTTSNSATGGAVYIGNKGTDQTPVTDPSPSDNHYKYFWALPYSNNGNTYGQPGSGSVNILGSAKGASTVAIGLNAGSGSYGAAYAVMIGGDANAGPSGVTIGNTAGTSQSIEGSVCIGDGSGMVGGSSVKNFVSLGRWAKASRAGEVNIGTPGYNLAFNNTAYRVIGGVHDGQELHDAATVAQGNTLSTSAPTTSTVGVLGQLYTDTTNMHTYQCTAISGSTYTWTQRW